MKLFFSKGAWASKKARERIKNLTMDDIKHIAVIRHSALGDMLLTRSFLFETRKAFKNAKKSYSFLKIPSEQSEAWEKDKHLQSGL